MMNMQVVLESLVAGFSVIGLETTLMRKQYYEIGGGGTRETHVDGKFSEIPVLQ